MLDEICTVELLLHLTTYLLFLDHFSKYALFILELRQV